MPAVMSADARIEDLEAALHTYRRRAEAAEERLADAGQIVVDAFVTLEAGSGEMRRKDDPWFSIGCAQARLRQAAGVLGADCP